MNCVVCGEALHLGNVLSHGWVVPLEVVGLATVRATLSRHCAEGRHTVVSWGLQE